MQIILQQKSKLFYLALLVVFLLYSLFSIRMLGYAGEIDRIAFTCLFFVLMHRFFPRILNVILIVFGLLMMLYHSTAAVYGKPSMGIFISMLDTNATEASEFISATPLSLYAWSVFCFLISLVVAWCASRISPQSIVPRVSIKKWLVVSLVLVIIELVNTWHNYPSWRRFRVRIIPIEFVDDCVRILGQYYSFLSDIKRISNKPTDWKIIAKNQPYDIYVLVIGESQRSDYSSLYGFSIRNNPFLEKRANIVFDHVYSAGANTQISLLHSLTLLNADKQPEIQDSIVNLAKKAGMSTYWLSNQGYVGPNDTLVSLIATQANHKIFLKKGGYETHIEIHDSALLPKLAKVLKDSQKPVKKFIVLHIMGSHPNPCLRIDFKPQTYGQNPNVNCYIDSIRATGKFLEGVVNLLEKTHERFSLLYFSDHGLSHYPMPYTENSLLVHGDQNIQNYHVPLLIINSTDKQQKRIEAARSGFHLINGLSQWLGVKTSNLDSSYDYFSNFSDKNIQMLDLNQQVQALDHLKDDPPSYQ